MAGGVYAVGNPKLTLEGRWMAAVLACGPEAVLSHGEAAALWGLQRPPSGAIHVTAATNHTHAGIRCHVAPLPKRDRTRIDGIPVASLGRTLLARASALNHQRLRSTLEAAQRRGILDVRALQELIAASVGRYGTHGSKRSFEGDRRRDTKLPIKLVHTVRFTAERIKAEPALVQRDLLGLIRSAAA